MVYINYINISMSPWLVLIHFSRICTKELDTICHRQFLGLLLSTE